MKLKDILLSTVSSDQLLAQVRNRMKESSDNELAKIKFLAKTQPEWVSQVISKADNAMQSMHILPGTSGKPFFVGNPPKWFESPFNDREYIWGLNRHFHFITLTQAYHITGDKKYAERAVYEFNDWIDSCPMPKISTEYNVGKNRFDTVSPWRSLELGIRMTSSWYTFLRNLINTEFFTAELLERFAISVYEQGKVLYEVTPVFWPRADHNHYLHEMFGLFAVSVMFPEFNTAKEWQAFAIKELERCLNVQFTPDGGQMEGSPGYHDACLRMVYECLNLAKSEGVELPRTFIDVAQKASTYTAFTIRPDGKRVALGDSDMMIHSVPKIIAAHFGVFSSLGVFENVIGVLDQSDIDECIFEYAILFGDTSSFEAAVTNAQANPKYGSVNYQRQLSQYIYRSGWDKNAQHFLFSCLTPVPNGHAHIDPMTFDLSMNGKSVVVDPGRYNYADNEWRRMLKSPQHHSTLTIADKPPFEYIDTWNYSPQKEGRIEKTYSGEVIGVDAVHFNYEPAVHKRLVCVPDDSLFVVLDDVYNPNLDDVRIYYHLQSTEVALSNDRVEAIDLGVKLYYYPKLSAQILDGYTAPDSDVLEPSKRVELTDSAVNTENTKYITIFSAEGEVSDITVAEQDGVILFSFKANSKEYSFKYRFGEFLEKA